MKALQVEEMKQLMYNKYINKSPTAYESGAWFGVLELAASPPSVSIRVNAFLHMLSFQSFML